MEPGLRTCSGANDAETAKFGLLTDFAAEKGGFSVAYDQDGPGVMALRASDAGSRATRHQALA